MQRRASSRYGAGKAAVGQMSRHERQLPQWSGSAASGGSSTVVRIAPRKSHEPKSRETRLVCLPCQPTPAAAASGFSINAAVSTNTFTSPPARAIEPARQRLQLRFDDLVVIVALRIDRDGAALALLQNRERIDVGRIVHAQHDGGTHLRHQRARIGAALRRARQPVHVAMRAVGQKTCEPPPGERDRVGARHAHHVEAVHARGGGEFGLELFGLAQKSRLA